MAVVPVFVSSTFRDFHGERDVIRSVVGPALDEVLRPLGARVELLDLRWGVDTLGQDEAMASQRVLDVCIDEVDRCRPLFLGLIGDRFGWTPSMERLEIASARSQVRSPIPASCPAVSVTGLEFWHGLLAPDAAAESAVAVRSLNGDVPADWQEQDPAGVDWLRGQVALVARRTPDRVRLIDYTARIADSPEGPVIVERDLAELAETLIQVLTPLVVARVADLGVDGLSGYAAAAHLLADSRSVVVGRDAVIAQVIDVLDQSDETATSPGAVLVADSGVGKTTVLLKVCDMLAERGWSVARVLIGVGSGSTSTRDVIQLLVDQLGLDVPTSAVNEQDLVSGEELLSWWTSALAGLPPRTLVAVDGLDRLDAGDAFDRVEVLRSLTTGRVRFLASTTSAVQAEVLQRRGVTAIPLGLLEQSGVAQAARKLARVYGRRNLPEPVVGQLSRVPRSGLWLTLAVGELSWLDRTDFARAESAVHAGQDAAMALTDMLVDAAKRLPVDDAELADRLLVRAAADVSSPEKSGLLLGSLALTRSGLTPSDMQALVTDGSDPLPVARARQRLGSNVVARDASGRLAFDHQLVRGAALARAGAAGWSADALHARLAEHLGSLAVVEDPVVTADWLWHSLLSGLPELAASALLCAADSRLELNAVADLIALAVRAGRGSSNPVLAAIRGLPEAAALQVSCLRQLGRAASRHGTSELTVAEWADLSSAAVELGRRLAAADSGDAQIARELSFVLGEVGEASVAAGDLPGARLILAESLEIARRLSTADPNDVQAERDVATVLDSIGGVAYATGDLAAAEEAYAESLAIARRLSALAPDDAEATWDVAVSLNNFGGLALAGGDVSTARAAFTEMLEIARQSARLDPISLERAWQVSAALAAVGDLALAAGDLSEARAAFTEMLDICRRVSAASPANAGWKRDVVVALDNVGRVLMLGGDMAATRVASSEAVQIARELAEGDPHNVEWGRTLTMALDNEGDVAMEDGDLAVAMACYSEGLARRRQMSDVDPSNAEWQRNITVSFDHLGRVAMAQGNLEEARALYAEGLEIARQLATAEPANSYWQRDVAVALDNLGRVLVATGDLDEARALYEECLDIARTLAEADRNNARAVRDVSVSLDNLGQVALIAGDASAARLVYVESLEIRRALVESNHTSAQAVRDVSVSLDNLGRVESLAGDLPAARLAFTESLELRRTLAATDAGSAQAQRDFSVSLWCLAELLDAGEQAGGSEALAAWAEVVKQFDVMREQGALMPADEQFEAHARSKAAGHEP